jgi:hypothetical protein
MIVDFEIVKISCKFGDKNMAKTTMKAKNNRRNLRIILNMCIHS